MRGPGAATRTKYHEACEKDKDCHDTHGMYGNVDSDSKLLSVSTKCIV